jgi:hypothetical protein
VVVVVIWKAGVLARIYARERGSVTQILFDSRSFALIHGPFLICDYLRKSAAMSFLAFLNTSRNIFSVSLPVRVFCSEG